MAKFLTEPVPHEEGAKFIAGKPALTRRIFDQLAPDLQARALVITGVEGLDAVARVRELLAELPRGGDFRDLKDRINAELSPWLVDPNSDEEEQAKQRAAANRRAELLLRMHGWQAYARTQYELNEAHADVFPYRQYLSSEDNRVRPHHAALNKKILPANHPFWLNHTPPWEFNCRCDCVVLTADEVDELKAAEANKPEEDKLVMPEAQLREIERNQRIVKPGGQGFLDIRTPREREGTGYEWRPAEDALSIDQILDRYTPAERQAFTDFAARQKLEDGRSLLEWWKDGTPAAAVPVRPPAAAPAPAIPAPAPGPAPAAPVLATRQTPVSKGLPVKATGTVGKAWKTTLAEIDKIHDDGVLPGFPATRAAKDANHLGVYHPSKRKLALKDGGPWMHLTAAHEIGHYLDHQALGTPGRYASQQPGHPAHAVVDLLLGTPTVATIRGSGISPKRRAYFTSRVEVWARAYAQFVAEESGQADLSADLVRVSASVEPWRQWTAAEFAPARAAIRDMFQKKGWM
jgi:SPP1 gp7 family putative phage head morphogenesis protein